jgi:hypothetical protein
VSDQPVGSNCPSCGQPALVAYAQQAFCGNDKCRILTWNPSKTLDENLDSYERVDLSDLPDLP